MNISSLLDDCRTLAGQTLTDTVHITRRGEDVTDDLGTILPGAPVAVYDGPGLVQLEQSRTDPARVAGEQESDAQRYVTKLPVGAPVKAGDTVEVVESIDPRHVGRQWVLTAVPSQGWAVLRRCPCDPVEVPDGR